MTCFVSLLSSGGRYPIRVPVFLCTFAQTFRYTFILFNIMVNSYYIPLPFQVRVFYGLVLYTPCCNGTGFYVFKTIIL